MKPVDVAAFHARYDRHPDDRVRLFKAVTTLLPRRAKVLYGVVLAGGKVGPLAQLRQQFPQALHEVGAPRGVGWERHAQALDRLWRHRRFVEQSSAAGGAGNDLDPRERVLRAGVPLSHAGRSW